MKHKTVIAAIALFAALSLGSVSANAAYEVLVAENGANQITRIDELGNTSIFANSNLDSPIGLAADASGNIYAVNNGTGPLINTVSRFTPTGAFDGIPFSPSNLNSPIGITFDNLGNAYVTNFGNTIEKFGPTGTDLGTIVSTGLNKPYGIIFDAVHNQLLVADFGSDTVKRFSTTGVLLGTFGVGHLDGPDGLVLDSAGNLLVSNFSKLNVPVDTIQKFAPTLLGDYTFTSTFATSASATTFLSGPIGMAYAPDGTLLVANNFDGTIEKFDSAGNDLGTLATGLNGPTFLVVRAVPEPASVVLMGLGGIGMLILGRRRTRRVS